jgi:organic radical activating enzyme
MVNVPALPKIPYTEIMITQVCNLTCKACSTYSDLDHKGYLTWDNGRAQIEPWLQRVTFDHFGLMGGEPLINPQIRDWLIGIRKLMPTTVIRLPTNGTLLHKNLDIVDLLAELGNIIFKITVHVHSQQIENSIKYVQDKFNWTPVNEYGVDRFKTGNNFKFQVNRPRTFYKTFQNNYENALPYDSLPTKAFDVCHQKECPLLINERIYKCSTSGLMPDILKKFKSPNSQAWKKYLDNNLNGSIGLNSTDAEIKNFIENIRKPHATCSQCPDKESIVSVDHLSNVTFRLER